MNPRTLLRTLPLFLALLSAVAAEKPTPWADFVEPEFPFFSSVVDGRGFGPDWPENNITPRALVLNLGHDCWAALDTDLLRVSALWHGGPLSAVSMSQVSYQTVGDKTPEGQNKLPKPLGVPWLANGIYPGWQTGDSAALTDPREPGPDPKEVGRGALADAKFKAIRVLKNGVILEYEIDGNSIQERMESRVVDGEPVVQRSFRLARVTKPLLLVVGQRPASAKGRLSLALTTTTVGVAGLFEPEPGLHVLQVNHSSDPVEIRLAVGLVGQDHSVQTWQPASEDSAALRWPTVLDTAGTVSTNADAYVVDNIRLPIPNPWQRNVRLADLGFFKDGRAAAVTFDGDVWILSGLRGDLAHVSWKRFASGLQEPLGLCLRDEKIFVNDRNGIWKLVDTDHNGEADRHELFSNAFRQTAETREYATGLRVLPDGSFVIAKGGITSSTVGRDNGSVLRVSSDGQTSTAIGWGLREPFIGVNRKTGLITASDQQGNYVPATPIHIIRDHQYYGYIPLILPKEQYPAPIADPLVWIPHPVNASAVGQVWLNDAQMGPLSEQLIHIGYYRPELFVVLRNDRAAKPQAAVVSLTQDLNFAPLNGCVNPIDGQLYVAGFKIWGTTAEAVSGLARVRYAGVPSTLPTEVAALDKGILLRFDVALDEKKALDLGNFVVERWNYKRTAAYGSPHFKLDGSKGQETITPSSVYLSLDHKSVFLGVPDLKPVMQMRVGFALATAKGAGFERSAYLTPYEFTPFKPATEGFGDVTVDLTPRDTIAAVDTTPVTAAEGQRLYGLMGCVACHSTDGTTIGKNGPSWKGLFGSLTPLSTGKKVVADEAYLLESIKDPPAKLVKGYDKAENAMPSYDGVMTEKQMRAMVEFIRSLK
jgi:mono/diheme cytochrome c family protein